jgi:hypothetical protein
MQVDGDLIETMAAQVTEQIREQWLAVQWEHGFGQLARMIAQSRAVAGAE